MPESLHGSIIEPTKARLLDEEDIEEMRAKAENDEKEGDEDDEQR